MSANNDAISPKPREYDWADNLALEVIADVQRGPFRDALPTIANRLRLVRLEGENIGHDMAVKGFQQLLNPKAPEELALQRDNQADYDATDSKNGWPLS